MSVEFVRMGMGQKMVFIIDREIEFSIEEKEEDILTILTDDHIKTSIGFSKTTKAIGDGAKAVGSGIVDGVKYLWNSF